MTQYPTDAGGEQGTTEQVKEQVTQKAEAAQEKARGRLRDQVDQRSTQAGERLAGTAADARGVAEELRRQGKDAPARLVEQAAGQADRAADYLKQASGDRILRDVEDFARSKPWAVAAGGLALGFAASRFLKASSGRRYREAQAGDGYPRQAPVTAYREETAVTAAYPAAGVPVVGTYDPDGPGARSPRAE
jgi:ElaB/YqjD/DUF883 family membrane-anchored ribosome-binding protein